MTDGLNNKLLVSYSDHGLNNELLVWYSGSKNAYKMTSHRCVPGRVDSAKKHVYYSGHSLNNELLPGI